MIQFPYLWPFFYLANGHYAQNTLPILTSTFFIARIVFNDDYPVIIGLCFSWTVDFIWVFLYSKSLLKQIRVTQCFKKVNQLLKLTLRQYPAYSIHQHLYQTAAF